MEKKETSTALGNATQMLSVQELLWRGSTINYLYLLSLYLESRSVMCNGAEEKQAHRCDPYGLRVQEQPLFLVCSRIVFFTPMDQVPQK